MQKIRQTLHLIQKLKPISYFDLNLQRARWFLLIKLEHIITHLNPFFAQKYAKDTANSPFNTEIKTDFLFRSEFTKSKMVLVNQIRTYYNTFKPFFCTKICKRYGKLSI